MRAFAPPIWGIERGPPIQLLLQQVMAGLASGAIYALVALAVIMIYQAIDHLNFAQGMQPPPRPR